MCGPGIDRTSWHNLATRLSRTGIHALTVDLRGYGDSGGDDPKYRSDPNFYPTWQVTGIKDVEAAYQFLRERPGVDGTMMGIAGASCGLSLGIETASKHDDVRALALLSGPFRDQEKQRFAGLKNVPALGAALRGRRPGVPVDHPVL